MEEPQNQNQSSLQSSLISPFSGRGALKICVLQPDYSTSDVDYQNYDPARNISHLMPEAQVDHVLLNKLSTYKQLKELKKKNYDVYR